MTDFRTFITEIFDRKFDEPTRKLSSPHARIELYDFWVDRIKYQVKIARFDDRQIGTFQFESSRDGGQTWIQDSMTGYGTHIPDIFSRLKDIGHDWLDRYPNYVLTFSGDHRKSQFYKILVSRLFRPDQVKIEQGLHGLHFEVRK